MNAFEPVVFGQAFEALFLHTLRGSLDAAAIDRLKGAGIDPTKPPLPAYPPKVWAEALQISARTLYPADALDEAYRKLGRAFMKGLAQTLQGKALFALGRVLGPRRMLPRMTRNFRSTNNYLDSALRTNADGSYELEVFVLPEMLAPLASAATTPPRYMLGIIEGMLLEGGVRGVDVALLSADPEKRKSTFRVSFQD